MDSVKNANPFSKQESHGPRSLLVYKVLTMASWLLVLITTVYFTADAPEPGKYNRSIWKQNKAYPTAFSLNPFITDIYWLVLFIAQLGYFWHLFSTDASWSTSAANLGSHHILFNLVQFGFVVLFVHGHFAWAELLVVINFFNLTILYFRHPQTNRFVHIPIVSMPLAWTFVALFWNGAISFNATGQVAYIFANIFVWSFLGWGLAFLFAFKDYTMGFAMTALSLSLAVHQIGTKTIALQWIFAFVVFGLLAFFSLAVAVPAYFGKELSFRGENRIIQDEETAPLLSED
ncbi:hypothetical protein MMC25_000632 [Agyrium rufum]|nr:hypothetical protein [Agyrium rufum]